MNGGLFAILDGAAPWWWMAAALILFIVEMLTFAYFAIWLAIAAMTVGILLLLSPDMNGQSQLIWFAALSILFTAAGRFGMARMGSPASENPALNRRAEALVKKHGVVLTALTEGAGQIEVGGTRWAARANTGMIAKGENVEVVSTEGMTLICKKV
ncbi:MAG: NfeD family protein [Pikeienuella sp.]